MFYGVEDVMFLIEVRETKAYEIIRELREELANTKIPGTQRTYYKPPAGKIQKRYFCERFNLDPEECDRALTQTAVKEGIQS